MDIIPANRRTYIGLGVAAVVIFGLLLLTNRSSTPDVSTPANQNTPDDQNAQNTPDSGQTVQTSPAKPSGSGTQKAPAPKPTGPVSQLGVAFVTPAKGDVWALNNNHPIIWNKEASAAGQLYLVDEATGKMAGWIVPSTGANQNSFGWDTRDVSIDRTGGQRKNVSPGMYSLRLAIDGKSGEVASVPFAIADAGSPQIVTYTIRLRDVKVTPNQLSVPHGAKVAFINNDSRPHVISGDGIEQFILAANGGTHTLDTTPLASQTYNWISSIYTYQAPGTLIVK